MNTIPNKNYATSIDEKLKQALIDNPVPKFTFKTTKIEEAPTQTHTIESVTGESVALPIVNQNKVEEPQKINGKKIFRIKKFVKYNKIISDLCSEEDSESEKHPANEVKKKKISPFSKVNFSKLKDEEKDDRLKNLAKLVKRLRRRVRNLEHKVKANPTKLLNKYLWNKLGINTKNKYLKPEFEFDFERIVKALKKIRNYDDFEFNDQKHIIENMINFIADDTLKLDSLAFKKICSLIRILLPAEKVRYISKKQSKVTISFPETEVAITNKEYLSLAKFKDNEDVLRAALGIENPKERTIKIVKEEPVAEQEVKSEEKVMPMNAMSGFTNANLLWMLNSNPQYSNLLISSLAMALNNGGIGNMGMNFGVNGVHQINLEDKDNNMFLK